MVQVGVSGFERFSVSELSGLGFCGLKTELAGIWSHGVQELWTSSARIEWLKPYMGTPSWKECSKPTLLTAAFAEILAVHRCCSAQKTTTEAT